MKALLCRQLGSIDDLAVGDIPSPPLGDGQVRVGVVAAGVNFPDILMVEGKYQVKPELPFIPGLEVAGTVMECGAGVDHVKPGDRVMAFARRGEGPAWVRRARLPWRALELVEARGRARWPGAAETDLQWPVQG